ncbi:glutathione transferase GstA [Morganella morganii]|uniref:glutathione transferase GstA n=1 Tax=Morganella morganii TaxID=582 RepID=UPI0034E536D6
MQLFYTPGSCALSPHIILRETGLDFSLVRVDLKAKKTENGDDYLKINPKGQVPALSISDSQLLTEGVAIVQYLADQKPDRKLIAPAGTMERYHQIEWLNYIASEVHKSYAPLFSPETPEDYRPIALRNLMNKFAYVDGVLAKSPYITGNSFTVADAYLFTVCGWAPHLKISLEPYPHLQAYLAKIAHRPHVQDAMEAEGLI